jgi:hypothetical protein
MGDQQPNHYPLVAISVLNWNGWRDTIQCLESTRQLDYPNYITIVVDNGSSNGSAERIKEWARESLGPGCAIAEYHDDSALRGGEQEGEAELERVPCANRLVLIRNRVNKGLSGGHNVAIRYALTRKPMADDVFILNNDVAVCSDSLTRLLSVQRSSNAGIVGASVTLKESPQLRFETPASFRASFFAPFVRDWAQPAVSEKPYLNTDFVIGTAMLIGRDVLTEIGGSSGEYFCSDLFFSGPESFCFAAKLRGYSSVIATGPAVEHLGGRSGGRTGSTLRYYYDERDLVLRARMMLPFHYRMLFYMLNLSRATGSMAKNLLRRRPRAAWAMLQGVLDGYRGRGGKWKYHDQEAPARG